jgi:hypothetical protein
MPVAFRFVQSDYLTIKVDSRLRHSR